jgi:sulfofructose kinase
LVSALIVPASCADRIAPGAAWQEQLEVLKALGPAFPAITAGQDGCWYLEDGEVRHQPAFPVDVVDTTGAGDVFHGAFAYGLGRGWAEARWVEFASAVAALSCRALGGPRAIPDLEETLALLREHGSGRWKW